MANELASSTSPYLRAHADNPVEWRMWTKDNLAEAARRDVPLLISIGYSTCHWCHVMAHESFEDEAIAAIINENFVPIKIDREELPDIDAHYMNALQAMTGQGGWPMTIFATPTGSPFYAGTYFPPTQRGNLPAFTQVLSAVSQTWTDRRAEVDQMTQRMDRGLAEMADAVSNALPAEAAATSLRPDELDAAAESLLDSYDPAWGGFGSAPKFPPMMNLMQLLATFTRLGGTASAGVGEASPGDADEHPIARVRAEGRLDVLGADGHLSGELELDCLIAVRSSFARIASGGMRDQVRGGIARYSVDRQWFVPHFEKMLYDNALYLRAAVAWAKVERGLNPNSKWLALAQREIVDTANFLIADLSGDDGFIAALDADSLNTGGVLEEGAAYVLRPEEFAEAGEQGLLGLVDSPAGAELSGQVVAAIRIVDWLGMEDAPFDAEHPAPWNTAATKSQRETLRRLLDRRPRPARDEKIITEWNALAITALAEAALYSGAETGTGDAGNAGADGAAEGWGRTAVRFWEGMRQRFADSRDPAEIDVRRSFTDGVAGPGRAGLADWAQFITAGITIRQLQVASGAQQAAGSKNEVAQAHEAAPTDELLALSIRMFAQFTSEAETLEVVDSLGDEILDVRSSDPTDNTLPSGRSAAAETALLLAELGIDAAADTADESTERLDTGRLIELRDRLLGVYRALAERAPRGCGFALWLSERALSPVRVASTDPDLIAFAAHSPDVTLITDSTGVPDQTGTEVAVPEGTAIVCRGTQCSLPVRTVSELAALLSG